MCGIYFEKLKDAKDNTNTVIDNCVSSNYEIF